ncbi:MAG: hypothetical protein C4547_13580 [Phycisphaerales bacterium]|nr:MAG: hypothetical protein C4547_13580 [Phycisphaerales bacterium]
MLLEGPPALRVLVAALVVLVPAASVLAAGTFIWDQPPGNGVWSNEDNWTAPATCTADCYPHTTDDDAIIDDERQPTLTLDDDYTIDDLTVSSGLIIAIAGQGYQLSCDSIVIDSGSELSVWDQVKVVARKTGDPEP